MYSGRRTKGLNWLEDICNKVNCIFRELSEKISYLPFYAYAQLSIHVLKIRCTMEGIYVVGQWLYDLICKSKEPSKWCLLVMSKSLKPSFFGPHKKNVGTNLISLSNLTHEACCQSWQYNPLQSVLLLHFEWYLANLADLCELLFQFFDYETTNLA